jgi:hypothetical protein
MSYTSLNVWFLIIEMESGTARYTLIPYIKQIAFLFYG